MSIWDDGSLLSNMRDNFVLLNRVAFPDGYGGFKWKWEDGPAFFGVLIDDQSTNARIGGVQTSTTFGTLKTPRHVNMEFHDAFRRESDGAVYRVSMKDRNQTPPTTDLDVKQYPVEQWTIPE